MVTHTAAHRRKQAGVAYLARLAHCPTHRLLDRIGSKWVSLVLKELADGPRRYGDLARTIAGVTPKMLTETLRGLERDGLVSRSVVAAVPARVDYRLTPLGESLLPVLHVVTLWAEQHIDAIDAARRSYDAGDRDVEA
ncbi:winged helix-turn-helix transcriptional regulator [Micromonospora sp. NPDC003197]